MGQEAFVVRASRGAWRGAEGRLSRGGPGGDPAGVAGLMLDLEGGGWGGCRGGRSLWLCRSCTGCRGERGTGVHAGVFLSCFFPGTNLFLYCFRIVCLGAEANDKRFLCRRRGGCVWAIVEACLGAPMVTLALSGGRGLSLPHCALLAGALSSFLSFFLSFFLYLPIIVSTLSRNLGTNKK